MPKFYQAIGFSLLMTAIQISCTGSKVPQQQTETAKTETAKIETAEKPKSAPRSGIRSYSDVITKEAVSDQGVFTIHKVGDKYYYEIPDTLLHRDFLWISRIATLPSGLGNGYLNAGSSVNEQMVVWQKFENKIVLKTKSYNAFAADSLPISLSVQANHYQPTR
jgi:hypothetical protein